MTMYGKFTSNIMEVVTINAARRGHQRNRNRAARCTRPLLLLVKRASNRDPSQTFSSSNILSSVSCRERSNRLRTKKGRGKDLQVGGGGNESGSRRHSGADAMRPRQ